MTLETEKTCCLFHTPCLFSECHKDVLVPYCYCTIFLICEIGLLVLWSCFLDIKNAEKRTIFWVSGIANKNIFSVSSATRLQVKISLRNRDCFLMLSCFSFFSLICLQGGEISLVQQQLLHFSFSFAIDGYKPSKKLPAREHYFISISRTFL